MSKLHLVHFSPEKHDILKSNKSKRKSIYFFDCNDDIRYYNEQEDREDYVDFCYSYGDNIHYYEFDGKILTPTVELVKELLNIDDEDDAEEALNMFYDTELEVKINEYAKNNGYDAVIYKDSTDGYEHNTVAVLHDCIIE